MSDARMYRTGQNRAHRVHRSVLTRTRQLPSKCILASERNDYSLTFVFPVPEDKILLTKLYKKYMESPNSNA
jgi:hypothetical protein